jgi:hypothetical protein
MHLRNLRSSVSGRIGCTVRVETPFIEVHPTDPRRDSFLDIRYGSHSAAVYVLSVFQIVRISSGIRRKDFQY